LEEIAVKDSTLEFARPEYLWILALAVPLAAGAFYWSWRVKQKLIRQFVQARLFSTLTVGLSPARQKFRLVLLLAALAGVLAALAGPRWGYSWQEARQRGLDVVVAMDTSRSMLARDAAPNRLEKAKLAAIDLMRQCKEDRLGLVAFAGSAFLQCPLTLDDEVFRQNLNALKVGIIPRGGTALSQAIRTALDAFARGNNNYKVLVLFTDGEDHDEDAETMGAAKEAADAGMRIFTVGVGTAEGELLQVTDEHGNTSFVKDEDGNVVKSHLNEELLRKIATASEGFYLPLRGANPMEILYREGLAPLPKSEARVKLTRVHLEHYHWFLGFAVLCLVAEMLLPEGPRPRRSPTAAVPATAGLPKAAVILCALLIPVAAPASGGGAFDKYQEGDYKAAFEEYNRLAAANTNDYRLHYNAGTSAYRAKDLEAAEKQLDAALNSPEIVSDLPAQEHAYYNLGNTLYRLGEPATDPKKKQEQWEHSIENYSRALRLNTNDLEAKSNLAFVKQKLEELKQQQQQQQQQKNQDNDNKNQGQKQQQQQNQQGQGQQQQQQDQQGQDQKNQQNQQPQSRGQNQQNQQNQAQQQQQQQSNKGQQNQSGQAKATKNGQQGKESAPDQPAASGLPAAMTLQQALQMLDAQKDDEKVLPFYSAQNQPGQTVPGKIIKDW
jgi:Ca-activated chloride channel family protein